MSTLAGVWVWDRVHTHPHCSSWNPAHASGFNSARPPPSSASKWPVSAIFSLMTGLCLSASCSCKEPGDLRALFRQARWLSAFYHAICLQNCALPSCGFCVKIFFLDSMARETTRPPKCLEPRTRLQFICRHVCRSPGPVWPLSCSYQHWRTMCWGVMSVNRPQVISAKDRDCTGEGTSPNAWHTMATPGVLFE